MSQTSADANLLFGALAFQNGFITRDQLVAGMQAWVENKRLPLDEHLALAGALAPDLRQMLQPLVAAHLRQHDDDPEKSLTSISSADAIKRDLTAIQDSHLQHSLQRLKSKTEPRDNNATFTLGASTSDGTRFHILRSHARGGLGEVFVARDTELGREVALKEIQLDKDDPESRGRFTREAEITGGLEHPGIVPVYGLGAYPDGRPFYAMRFIRGNSLQEAIRAYHGAEGRGQKSERGTKESSATEKNLELRRLLQRFIDVCEAIDYAHSRGVLHRDLKPGNIMLGRYGETLVVDWGLAKAAGSTANDAAAAKPLGAEPKLQLRSGESSATVMGAAMGTPAYMPPEQAEGRLDVLSPASDVYSLGATLYSILTGQSPVQGQNVAEVLEKVRRGQIEPPRRLDSTLPRPLEAICLKAMALQPPDRYQSAKELADEVEHWLADEPVAAHRESWLPRLRRSLRKRPMVAGSIFASLLVGLLAVGAGSLLLGQKNQQLSRSNANLKIARDEALGQKRRAEKSAEQAAAEKERVRKAMEFLVAAFRKPDPSQDGRDVKAADLLLAAAAEAQTKLEDEPLLQAELLNAIGLTFHGLGMFPEFLSVAEVASRLRRNLLAPDHPDMLTATDNLASAYANAGQFEKALPLLKETLKRRQQQLGRDHIDTLLTMNNLAAAYLSAGQVDKALALHEETLNETREKLGPNHLDTLGSMNNLATAYQSARQFEKALSLLEETLKRRQEQLGADHVDTLRAMSNLATAYATAEQWAKALPLHERTLTKLQERLGHDHPDTLISSNNLASAYLEAGLLEKALSLLEETAVRTLDKLGPYHPDTLTSMSSLASAYKSAGQLEKALQLLEKTLRTRREKLDADHPDTLLSMNELASAYSAGGQFEKALPLHEEALTGTRDKFGTDHPDTLGRMGLLASAYASAGQFDKALPLHEETVKRRQALLGRDHLDTLVSMNNLASAYALAGQAEKALPLLEETLKQTQEKRGLDHPNTLTSMNNLAQVYALSGQIEKALPHYEEALKRNRTRFGPHHPNTLQALMVLAEACKVGGATEKALALWEEYLAAKRKSLRPDSMELAGELAACAPALLELKAYGPAERALRDSLKVIEKQHPDHWMTFMTNSLLGGALAGHGEQLLSTDTEAAKTYFAAAEPLLQKGFLGMLQREEQIPTNDRMRVIEGAQRLIDLYQAWDKPVEVEKWKTKLKELDGIPVEK